MNVGPGMHYLHDFNIQVTSKEIIMNFKGENTQLFIDDIMSLSFVYVKTGYEALIVDRKGEFKSLPSGLYFLQSPASFKTFVSIDSFNVPSLILRVGNLKNKTPLCANEISPGCG